MIKEAVFHQADSEMCYLTDDGKVVITLKAKKDDIDRIVMLYDDRYDKIPKQEFIRIPLAYIMSDELYDYFGTEFVCPYTRLCYYFLMIDKEGNHTYFYQDGFRDTYSWGRQQLFQLPYLHKQDTPQVPKWLKESIMYQLFPDSFANGKERLEEKPTTHMLENGVKVESRFGGTIKGIIDNLDYLQGLGINLLYLNPVFTANSYHKYDEVDYYTVDPCLGTNEELKELVRLCHECGIRVMLDLVFNQSSSSFFAFRDVLQNGENSSYKDWYHLHGFPVKMGKAPNYETFAFYDVMPKFNTEHTAVEEYLLDIARFWIREYDIDGYRLDVANELPHEFWRRFRREMDKMKTEFALIGEVWHDSASWIGRDQFHSVMNYPLLYAMWEFFGYDGMNAYQFAQTINRLTMKYRIDNIQVMMNFIDSHDVARFLTISGVKPERQKMASAFLMTYIGLPTVYYGDEKALEGNDINDSRRIMIWKDEERSLSMYYHYQKLIKIRKENPVFIHGKYIPFQSDVATNLFGFVRGEGDEQVVCLFYNNSRAKELSLALEGEKYADLMTGELLNRSGDSFILPMEPFGFRILKLA